MKLPDEIWNDPRDTFIFDLDGTLANIDHRRHLVTNGNHNWDEFYQQCVNDEPNVGVLRVCRVFKNLGRWKIVIFSGRSEVVKTQTVEWLQKYRIGYDELLMRPDKDSTPDDVLKRKWLNENIDRKKIIAVFDDRDKVVKMWRDEGLECFQVANGNF